MDPSLFQKMKFVQTLHGSNQSAKTQNQIASELADIKRLLDEEAKKPKCPHCGSGVNNGYSTCKNCGKDLIWVGEFVGKPGQEAKLRHAQAVHEAKQAKETKKRLVTAAEYRAKRRGCYIGLAVYFGLVIISAPLFERIETTAGRAFVAITGLILIPFIFSKLTKPRIKRW
tara:strand:- start:232 stop:744 length:513 start_codon:yes stop_codon:yes gene_type:complete